MWTLGREEFLRQDKRYKTEKLINLTIQIKTSIQQNMMNKIKRQATGWEEIFASYSQKID